MSTMNITIIIPALQLPPAAAVRKDSGSPQPTTPFPPINLSPSPTPSLTISHKSSCCPTPTSVKSTPAPAMILSHQDTTIVTTSRTTMSSRAEEKHEYQYEEKHHDHHQQHHQQHRYHDMAAISRENSMNEEESFEDYYEDDTFLLPLTSASESPQTEVPSSLQPPPSSAADLPNDNSIDVELDSSVATLMHYEEVSANNNDANGRSSAHTYEDTASEDEHFGTLEDTVIVESSHEESQTQPEDGDVSGDQEDTSNNSELNGLALDPSRHSANSDTISVDSRPTESNSSPETVIHVLKSSNPESENEANDLINQSASNSRSCSPQKSYRETPSSLSVKQTLVRQVSMHEYERHGSPNEEEATQEHQGSEEIPVSDARNKSPDASTQTLEDNEDEEASKDLQTATPLTDSTETTMITREATVQSTEEETNESSLSQTATSPKHSKEDTQECPKPSTVPLTRTTSEKQIKTSQKVPSRAMSEDPAKSTHRVASRSSTAGSTPKNVSPTETDHVKLPSKRSVRSASVESVDSTTQTVNSQPNLLHQSIQEEEEEESQSKSSYLTASQTTTQSSTETVEESSQNNSEAFTPLITEKQISSFSALPPDENEQQQQQEPLLPPPPVIVTTPASAKGSRTESQAESDTHVPPSESENEQHETVESDAGRPSDGEQETDGDKYETIDESETNAHAEDSEPLREFIEVVPSPKPKKRLKSSRRNKAKVFPNPRKPSNYPQRMNKVTLARQALAREKRRVYVEERIQSYIKNAQANNIPLATAIPLSSSTAATMALAGRTRSISEVIHHRQEEEEQQESSKAGNNAEITTTIKTVATTTTTTVQHKVETPTPTVNELQSQILHSKTSAVLHPIPEAVDANNYYLNNPISVPPPPHSFSAIQVARVHNHHHHRRTPFKPAPSVVPTPPISTNNSSPGLPVVRALPGASTVVPENIIFHQPQPRGVESIRQTIFAVPAVLNVNTNDSSTNQNAIEAAAAQKTWRGVEHHGYFYSFRVRQSGPVQMMDKGVQTGSSTVTATPPQTHSYTLSFSETHSSNSSFIVSTNPFPPDSAAKITTSEHTVMSCQSEAASITSDSKIPDDRDKILREITETVQLRHDAELRRAELVQRANDLQMRVKEKRDKINRRHEFWHKKYIEESALTRPLEASCSSLRAELNTVHRRLLAHLEGRDLPLRLRDGPSKKANYKIMAARLQHEIKELQQKVKAAKLKLESEIKLKEQAEREVREIRNDLAHKKVVMSLARSQISTLPAVHPRVYDPLIY